MKNEKIKMKNDKEKLKKNSPQTLLGDN